MVAFSASTVYLRKLDKRLSENKFARRLVRLGLQGVRSVSQKAVFFPGSSELTSGDHTRYST